MPDTVDQSAYGPIYPITITKADLVLSAADAAGHKVTRVYGYNTTPDHNNKQCIDFMHYGDTAMRDWLVSYLIANKAALGVEGIISNHRVMGFPSNGTWYRGPEGQWRTYTGPNPHTDHVHCQFNTAPVKGKITGGSTGGAGGAGGGGPAPKWDGKSFPGRSRFYIGAHGAWVTYLGQRLVAHGYGKHYQVGPGPTFSEADRENCQDFQKAQGWSGSDADGYPGPETWKRLVAAPPKAKPKKPSVSLSKVVEAARKDGPRPQGGTTPGAVPSVKLVEAALQAEGLLSAKYATDGSFGTTSVTAYAAWQRRCGYSGKDADGIPGEASLKKLGAKHGFTVGK